MDRKKLFKYSLIKSIKSSKKDENLIFGNYGIKSANNGLIYPNNIENLRRKFSKQFKRISIINKSKIFFRLSLWKGFTKKPLLSRMGKGSGNIVKWKTLLYQGLIFMEFLTLISFKFVKQIFRRAIKCFPLKLILVKRT